MELDLLIKDVGTSIDAKLETLVPSPSTPPVSLHEAIRWSLFAGGKRVRPLIVFASGRTFSAPDETLVTTAAAIEMVHTYSLIHDDLPAMDDDDLRRGRASCHVQFGEATAILSGDVLQTLAFGAIADDVSIPAEKRVKLISLLSRSAGTPDGMVAGQQLDLAGEGQVLTIGDVEAIHSRKTGALICAAALAGAILGDATEAELTAIRSFAERIGLLFQITDDLLDVTQATETLGKTAGKDARSDKATYPQLVGVERASEMASATRDEANSFLNEIDRDTTLLRELTDKIYRRTT